MSYVRENTVESYLKKRVREIGGRSYKWVSPGEPGVMDQIVMVPWLVVTFFVETKAPSVHKMRKAQQIQANRLREMNRTVLLINTRENVDWFINYLMSGKPEE